MDYIDVSNEEIQSFYKQIAKNVKEARKKQNVTQLDLALTIGHKSMSTIAKIEAGIEKKHYNLEHLYKISKALDIKMIELLENI
ncbi:MAG: XRE family transcriptional regulator [Epsilonproteobacteria bacterium]|nr:MAG: XRE family transcriptional regulator [Campylobacterota bacterium]